MIVQGREWKCQVSFVDNEEFSNLLRFRMMVKGFKIEVGIFFWDLQVGWDLDMYGGVEKAFQMVRRSGQNIQYSRGRSMLEWKVNQFWGQIDKYNNFFFVVRFWLDKYFDFFSFSFYSFKMGIIIFR